VGAPGILVADDEPAILDLVVQALRGRDYAVKTASGAFQALEMVETEGCFDLLLSHVIMPGMSGPELAVEIVRLCPWTAVVMMSAYAATAQFPSHASFISKPFAVKDLIAAAEGALERSPKARERINQALTTSAELRSKSPELRHDAADLESRAAENRRSIREQLDKDRSPK
jgi:DNA-binding NtrC family response regulator